MDLLNLYERFLFRDVLRYTVPGVLVLSGLRIISLALPKLELPTLANLLFPFDTPMLESSTTLRLVLLLVASWVIGLLLDRVSLIPRHFLVPEWDRRYRSRIHQELFREYERFRAVIWTAEADQQTLVIPQKADEREESEQAESETGVAGEEPTVEHARGQIGSTAPQIMPAQSYQYFRDWMASVASRVSPSLGKDAERQDTLERFYFNIALSLLIWMTAMHIVLFPPLVGLLLGAANFAALLCWIYFYWLWNPTRDFTKRCHMVLQLAIPLAINVALLVVWAGANLLRDQDQATLTGYDLPPKPLIMLLSIAAPLAGFALIWISAHLRLQRDRKIATPVRQGLREEKARQRERHSPRRTDHFVSSFGFWDDRSGPPPIA